MKDTYTALWFQFFFFFFVGLRVSSFVAQRVEIPCFRRNAVGSVMSRSLAVYAASSADSRSALLPECTGKVNTNENLKDTFPFFLSLYLLSLSLSFSLSFSLSLYDTHAPHPHNCMHARAGSVSNGSSEK